MIKIALAQFSVETSQLDLNLIQIENYLTQAKEKGAAVLLLPELCTTGFNWQRNRDLLDAAAEIIERVKALAAKNSISVCGSFLEQTELGNAANTLFYFSADGEQIAKYRKAHLFSLFQEDKNVEAGNEVVIADTDLGRTGFSICYDLRFPELFRKCALAGAEYQILPAAFPHPRLEHWRTLMRARAIENQSFMIATNQCGCEGPERADAAVRYFGHSMVVDPWGQILLEADEAPGLFTVELDLSQPARVRSNLTALKDRRPEIY